MASISLGEHFEKFAQEKIAEGRYQNVSEIVRAGLRLLEDYEMSVQERMRMLKAKVDEAWDDPRPGRPAAEVFEHIETLHAQTVKSAKHGRG